MENNRNIAVIVERIRILFSFLFNNISMGRPCGVMAKVLNCNIEVSEFELKSRYYVQLWERYETPYNLSFRLNSINVVLLQGWFRH